MKKILICALCLSPLSLRAEQEWGGFYASIKASLAVPVVSGHKERYSTADSGITYTKDFHSDFKTDTNSKIGAKPAVGVIFNTPGILGSIRLEAEYSYLGNIKTGIQSPGDIIDTSNINTNNPDQGGNLVTDFRKLMNVQTRSKSFFGNIYYSLNFPDWPASPYIGTGIGYSSLDISSIYSNGAYFGKESDSFNKLAYNISAGIEMQIYKEIAIDLGYRYSRLGDVKFSMLIFDFNTDRNGGTTSSLIYRDDINMSFAAHEITMGVRYRF